MKYMGHRASGKKPGGSEHRNPDVSLFSFFRRVTIGIIAANTLSGSDNGEFDAGKWVRIGVITVVALSGADIGVVDPNQRTSRHSR